MNAELRSRKARSRSLVDLAAVAQAIPGGTFALIGHSWGGAIVIKGGRRLGVERIVAVDPMIYYVGASWAADFVDDLVSTFDLAPDARVPAIEEMFAGSAPVEIAAKVHAMRTMTIAPIVALGADNAVESGGWDLREEMRAYPKPLLLLLADPLDSVVSSDDLAFVRANAGTNVTIEIFEGEGHTLHRSAFERYAGSTAAFLRR